MCTLNQSLPKARKGFSLSNENFKFNDVLEKNCQLEAMVWTVPYKQVQGSGTKLLKQRLLPCQASHWCSTSNGYKILNQKVVIEGMFVKICQQCLCDIICCEKYVVWLCISSSRLQTDPKKRFTTDSINILNFHSFLMMSRPLILQRAAGYTPLTCWTHQVTYLPIRADTAFYVPTCDTAEIDRKCRVREQGSEPEENVHMVCDPVTG